MAPQRTALLIGAAIAASAWGARAAPPGLLAQLQPGRWVVTSSEGPTRALCLGDPSQLVRLAHPGSGCHTTAVEEAAGRVTVQYVCRGEGYGRTTIRRETAALVQIESQGVARGAPFQFAAEGRRTGACR